MAECKKCYHKKVCKYADEKVSIGIVVRETIHECINYKPISDVVLRNVYEQVKWERDTAIEQLKSYGIGLGEKADVTEVKHGEWKAIVKQDNYFEPPYCDTCKCSVCGYVIDVSETVYNYCPNCGAKMRRSDDKNE